MLGKFFKRKISNAKRGEKILVLVDWFEVEVPKGGFVEGGWYNGRQYVNGTFGRIGVVNSGSGLEHREMTVKEKNEIEQMLHNNKIYK